MYGLGDYERATKPNDMDNKMGTRYIGKHRLEVFCLIFKMHLHFICYTRLKIEVNLQDVQKKFMKEEDAKENWNLFWKIEQ